LRRTTARSGRRRDGCRGRSRTSASRERRTWALRARAVPPPRASRGRHRECGRRRPRVPPSSSSVSSLHRALDLTLRVALDERAALVDRVLAACERELDLDTTVLEVQARRNECQALLAHLAVEAVDLAAVKQQLARPRGVVVRAVSLVVDRDLGAVQP